MKKLFTFLTMLVVGIVSSWADGLSGATVGVYLTQETPVMTFGGETHTITKDANGNVTISPNSGSYGETTGRFTCTLVVKINVPSTTAAGVLCEMRQNSNNTTSSQGLYMDTGRLLKTSWQSVKRTNGTIIDAGEHTIIYTTGNDGAKVYVDGTNKLEDSGLKASGVSYKAIYIPATYAQYLTEVHFFSSVQSASNITSISNECSNHIYASKETGESVTVPSGKTLIIDTDANLSKFSGASSIAIAYTKTLTLNNDNSSISLSGSGAALQSSNITTTVTGSLTEITLKATAGTLTYTGTNLNGTTLDGVILGGSNRITTAGTVNIKNLAGNNLTNSTNSYAFVGSGTLNFYGTCDLTKKSDGSATTYSKLGYGSSASINIKEYANVTTTAVLNTTTSNDNAPVIVGSNATLGGEYVYGNVTLGEGSNTTLSNQVPFNRGAVTVSGDATLNLTASNVTLNQAITIDSRKTLTIDGSTGSTNIAEITLPNSLTNNGTIHFKDAILNLTERDFSELSYTFNNCTAQFAETGDEYKNGGFTITNIPSGVTVKVKKYDATTYEAVTIVDGTATFSHDDVGVSGYAAWLDYTFNESTKARNIHTPADNQITNAGNAGSGEDNNLKIDGSYTTATSYNNDGTLKVMSTPYRSITWPTNYTVAVAGNVPDVENGCLVAFGSTSAGSKNYLAIVRGANQNEIKLVKGHEMNSAFEVISTMTAANATALSHLVVFTKNGNTFTVYLDGIQKTQVTYSDALGGGFQIGSIHGGVTGTGVGRVADMSDDIKNKIFAKAVRVYDYVISDDQMSLLTEEFPYTSYGGKYTRTISENSNLSATDAWLNTGTQGNVDIPVNAVVDEVTYYPDVEITTDAASTLTVNADMDTENIKFDGAGKLTIASDGTHNISIKGSVTVNGPVSIKYGEIDLSAVPVTIGASGSVEFDFSASDFSNVYTLTEIALTGNASDYGSKVTGVFPSDDYREFTVTHNEDQNRYYLTITLRDPQDVYAPAGTTSITDGMAVKLTVDAATNDGILIQGDNIVFTADANVQFNCTAGFCGIKVQDGVNLTVDANSLPMEIVSGIVTAKTGTTIGAVTGTGTLSIPESATAAVASIANTTTLTGAGNVTLSDFNTTGPTMSSWTGSVTFPTLDNTYRNLTEAFNAWGNANSTIKLNSIGGYFNASETVVPTLNILSGATVTINNGNSENTPVLNKVIGAGILEHAWSGGSNHTLKIATLTDFTGTLRGTNQTILVEKLAVSSFSYDTGDKLISTSGNVTLQSLMISGIVSQTYSWETREDGIYITGYDVVQAYRDLAMIDVLPYKDYMGAGVCQYTVTVNGEPCQSWSEYTTAVGKWNQEATVPQTFTINQPTSGFYRFKAAARSKSDASKNWYMGGNADGIYSASTTDAKASDVNTIFYLEKDGNGYHPISYFSGLRSAGTAYHNVDDNSNFTLSQAIKEDDTTELLGEYKMVNGSNNTIVMWSDAYLRSLEDAQNNDWSGWTIEPVEEIPVTFKKSALGYATFFTPAPLRIPKNGSGGYDIHAYVCKMDGTKLTFYDITNVEDEVGRIIPVNTAVMLYNSTVKDGEDDEVVVNFTISSKDDVVIDNNSFRETLATVTPETLSTFDGKQHTIYSLRTKTKTDGSKVMGFYERTSTSNCAGFKAWLMTEKEAQARNFTIYFDGEEAPTGIIEALGLENDNVEIYDLNGRKLSTYKKGINIVNGKKVMVK